ncbi:uroporphyrinogen decarboxylase family protein [Verrucomicrobiota bacterium]
MNARERYIKTVTFQTPDRIPFTPGGPRESTLAAWHTQGLPEGANWHQHCLETLGIEEDTPKAPKVALDIDFRMRPQYEEKVLSHKNGQYIVQDWKGNICEISDEFDVTYLRSAKDFVTRRWIKCPVENRDDWDQMKTRYDPDDPGRLPDDLDRRCKVALGRDYVLYVSVSGPFWQMREWCGFEGLCMMMIDDPGLVADMAAFWTDFVSNMLERVLRHGQGLFDCLSISEDMAYKTRAMISPHMTREFCKPSWERWTAQVRAAGVPLVDMDSDGYVGELIPIWIESGINICDPIEVAAENDINEFRRRFGRNMAYRQGVDKRAIARGGQTIRDELKRLQPVVEDGGFIPGCDHGVPSDISWPNFIDYSRLLAEMTGWL